MTEYHICRTCNFEFLCPDLKREHEAEEHGIYTQPEPYKLICKKCHKEFIYREHYILHKKNDVCMYRQKYYDALKRHHQMLGYKTTDTPSSYEPTKVSDDTSKANPQLKRKRQIFSSDEEETTLTSKTEKLLKIDPQNESENDDDHDVDDDDVDADEDIEDTDDTKSFSSMSINQSSEDGNEEIEIKIDDYTSSQPFQGKDETMDAETEDTPLKSRSLFVSKSRKTEACERCPATYESAFDLKVHQMLNHPEDFKTDADPKKTAHCLCIFCHDIVSFKQLKYHMLLHTATLVHKIRLLDPKNHQLVKVLEIDRDQTFECFVPDCHKVIKHNRNLYSQAKSHLTGGSKAKGKTVCHSFVVNQEDIETFHKCTMKNCNFTTEKQPEMLAHMLNKFPEF